MAAAPQRPQLDWNFLGRQLKIWKHRGINDGHITKMLKLWLGYEFMDLMDDAGKIPRFYFNEVRQRLGYKTWGLMLDDIRRSQSFYLVNCGNKETEDADFFFSPIWHSYEQSDGKLLAGSIPISESQNESQKVSQNATQNIVYLNNIVYPNGVNARAFSFGEGTIIPDGNQKQMYLAKRKVVREYFAWFVNQTDSDHLSVIKDFKFKIANPVGKNGKSIPGMEMDEEKTKTVFKILIEDVLVPYFIKRESFFNKNFMSKPESRIWWLKNLFRKNANVFVQHAVNIWLKKRKQLEQEAFKKRYLENHKT